MLSLSASERLVIPRTVASRCRRALSATGARLARSPATPSLGLVRALAKNSGTAPNPQPLVRIPPDSTRSSAPRVAVDAGLHT